MTVQRRRPLAAKVAVFGVGLDTYWAQFPGLLDELTAKLGVFLDKLAPLEVHTKNFGMIDNARAAYAALPKIKAFDPDLVFVDMLTYATSATFAAITRDLSVPVVLVALQPLNTTTHGRFKPDVRTFLTRWAAAGPTHHFALGIGHRAATLQKVAAAFGIECIVIPG